MPMIERDDADTLLRGPIGREPPTPPPTDFVSVVGAAFQQNNSVVSLFSRLNREQFPPDLGGHNPLDVIKDTPYFEHANLFLASQSEAETRAIMRRIDGEDQRNATLDASGWAGTLVNLAAAGFDATSFLPGGALVHSVRGGFSAIRSAGVIGAASGVQAAVQESILQATQETRTAGESIAGIGTATLLGGLLGGGLARYLSKGDELAGRSSLLHARANLNANRGEITPEVRDTIHADLKKADAAIKSGDVAKAETLLSSIEAYHGSPHSFEAFDLSKVGTGEGSDTRGRGLYFAESRDAAAHYQAMHGQSGQLYQVRISANKEHLLDWDEPLSKQGQPVKDLVERLGLEKDILPTDTGKDIIEKINNAVIAKEIERRGGHETITPTEARDLPTQAMMEAGIPGIKYLDAGSREGGGTHNFVVFDDKRVQITHKNDVPVAQAAPGFTPATDFTPAPAGAAYADTRELSPVPYGLEKIGGEKLVAKMFPNINALTNGDITTKRIVADLTEVPIRVNENLTGGTTTSSGGPAVGREVSMLVNGAKARMGDELTALWSEHVYGERDIKFPRARDTFNRLTGQVPAGSNKLSWDEFDAAIYDALSKSDTHEIPEVQKAAQWIRKEILDPVSERAEKAIEGFEKTAVREGESYAPRIWNTSYIRANMARFAETWTDWLVGEQRVKANIQGRLTALQADLEAARKRIEDADKAAARPLTAREQQIEAEEGHRAPVSLQQRRIREAADAKIEHDKVRGKIEEELAKWEGKTTNEVKTAIKAREKYHAEAVAENKRTETSPRLQMADKAIDDAVNDIVASDRGRSRDELKSRAQEIVQRIIGSPEGRLPYDENMGGPQTGIPTGEPKLRGHMETREIDLPYDIAAPYLDRNATRSINSYLKTMVPDTVIAERFDGDPNMLAQFKDIQDAYAKKLENVAQGPSSEKLIKQRDEDMRIVAGLRDRERGLLNSDPGMRNLGRISQSVLRINNIVSSHMMAVSSIPDFAGVVFRHGLESAFSDGWKPFLARMLDNEAWEAWKKAGDEWKAFGVGIEMSTAARQHAFDDIHELYRPASRVERALAFASDKSFIANLLAPMTDVQKRIATNVASNNILRASRAVAEGKATAKQIALLGESNISPHVAEKIWKQFNDVGGENVKGVLLPNLADWTSEEARLAFAGAVTRDVDIAVVTPGQEKPLWMSKPGFNLLGQYKSFAMSATARIMIANLQRADAAALSGVIASLGLGMMAYKINTFTSGQKTSDRLQDWVKEGISRSGILGIMDDANSFMAKATRGGIDVHRLYGADKPLSKFANRDAASMFLGPTYGKIQNLTKLSGAIAGKDWKESDTHALRMTLLGSNMPYFPRLFEQVEKGFNNQFGIEMKPKP